MKKIGLIFVLFAMVIAVGTYTSLNKEGTDSSCNSHGKFKVVCKSGSDANCADGDAKHFKIIKKRIGKRHDAKHDFGKKACGNCGKAKHERKFKIAKCDHSSGAENCGKSNYEKQNADSCKKASENCKKEMQACKEFKKQCKDKDSAKNCGNCKHMDMKKDKADNACNVCGMKDCKEHMEKSMKCNHGSEGAKKVRCATKE